MISAKVRRTILSREHLCSMQRTGSSPRSWVTEIAPRCSEADKEDKESIAPFVIAKAQRITDALR